MFHIRPASLGDVLALVELERGVPALSHWTEADYRRIFDAVAPLRIALVAAEQDIVGFLVARAGVEWEIENLAVAEAVRRRGIGTALLAELLSKACSAGTRDVFLEVRESNLPARRLYHSAGFRPTGRRLDYYREPVEDAMIYRILLPSEGPKSG